MFIPSNPVQPHPLQLKGYIEVGPSPLVRSPLETQIETVINRFDPPIDFNRVHVTTLYSPDISKEVLDSRHDWLRS